MRVYGFKIYLQHSLHSNELSQQALSSVLIFIHQPEIQVHAFLVAILCISYRITNPDQTACSSGLIGLPNRFKFPFQQMAKPV